MPRTGGGRLRAGAVLAAALAFGGSAGPGAWGSSARAAPRPQASEASRFEAAYRALAGAGSWERLVSRATRRASREDAAAVARARAVLEFAWERGGSLEAGMKLAQLCRDGAPGHSVDPARALEIYGELVTAAGHPPDPRFDMERAASCWLEVGHLFAAGRGEDLEPDLERASRVYQRIVDQRLVSVASVGFQPGAGTGDPTGGLSSVSWPIEDGRVRGEAAYSLAIVLYDRDRHREALENLVRASELGYLPAEDGLATAPAALVEEARARVARELEAAEERRGEEVRARTELVRQLLSGSGHSPPGHSSRGGPAYGGPSPRPAPWSRPGKGRARYWSTAGSGGDRRPGGRAEAPVMAAGDLVTRIEYEGDPPRRVMVRFRDGVEVGRTPLPRPALPPRPSGTPPER